MKNIISKFPLVILIAIASIAFVACPSPDGPGSGGETPNAAAATVNGTTITLEEVDRALKAQSQGQESKLGPMEYAQARLQILEQLIQQEVMFQKAQAEKTIPTDEEVTQELNKLMTASGLSQEEWAKRLKESGQTEETAREGLKKQIAAKKLVEKITGKVVPPKEAEIKDFYETNKERFVRKRGVEMAAIVVDPRDSGQPNDKTTNEAEVAQRFKEINQQLANTDFGTVARNFSEDASAVRGGELGPIPEENLKSQFSPQFAAQLMSEQVKVGSIIGPVPIAGRFFILKIKDRIEKDEKLSLEDEKVKQQITDVLVNNKKQLLAGSYQAIAMNNAKIVNFLAEKVVKNPNDYPARPIASKTDDKKADDKSDEKSDEKADESKSDDAKKDESKSETSDENKDGEAEKSDEKSDDAKKDEEAKKDDAATDDKK